MTLPYITKEIEGIGGKIRGKPEFFIVEEKPVYEPCGKGEHLYANITKKGITSRDVQLKLAKMFGLKNSDIGLAGMKDKNAVTTQTFSIRCGVKQNVQEAIDKIETMGVKVNWAKFHGNKIRVGHLLGNNFRIVIHDIETDDALERAEKIKEKILEKGVPNFYGEQRFGIEGRNVQRGMDVLSDDFNVRNKWLKRFMISGYQSHLCNLYLAKRIEKGCFEKIMKGDVAKKYDTGGLFVVEDVKAEQERYDNKEISFTAPIYGIKMMEAKDEAKELEDSILKDNEVDMKQFENMKVEGTRRLGRVLIKEIDIKEEKGNLVLSFFLPKGAFATTILREFMKKD